MTIYDVRFHRDVSQGLAYKYWWEILPVMRQTQNMGVKRPWGYERFGR